MFARLGKSRDTHGSIRCSLSMWIAPLDGLHVNFSLSFYFVNFLGYYFIIVSCFHLSLASWLLFSNKVQFPSSCWANEANTQQCDRSHALWNVGDNFAINDGHSLPVLYFVLLSDVSVCQTAEMYRVEVAHCEPLLALTVATTGKQLRGNPRKEWRDLENQVRGRSRSLKTAPFNRPYATFYWSAIVNIALSCAIFKLFDVA